MTVFTYGHTLEAMLGPVCPERSYICWSINICPVRPVRAECGQTTRKAPVNQIRRGPRRHTVHNRVFISDPNTRMCQLCRRIVSVTTAAELKCIWRWSS